MNSHRITEILKCEYYKRVNNLSYTEYYDYRRPWVPGFSKEGDSLCII